MKNPILLRVKEDFDRCVRSNTIFPQEAVLLLDAVESEMNQNDAFKSLCEMTRANDTISHDPAFLGFFVKDTQAKLDDFVRFISGCMREKSPTREITIGDYKALHLTVWADENRSREIIIVKMF